MQKPIGTETENIQVERVNVDNTEDLLSIAESSDDGIKPNNKMIYYLACTALRKYTFVAKNQSGVIGFIFAFPDTSGEYLWVHQIAVHPEWRGRKVGTTLLKHLEKVLSEEGRIQQLKMAVRSSNRAINLYKRLGYKKSYTDNNIQMDVYSKIL